MEKIPCSVGMLTFNSGKTLRRALESVKDFDDIVLCDGGSTDDTFKIAQQYGARIISTDSKYNYADTARLADGGGARNQMMQATKYDWYLWLDSDENISPELHEEVARIVETPYRLEDPLAYRVPIRIIIDGKHILYSSNYPGYQFRFFNKKSGGHLTKRAHNRVKFNPGTIIGTLKNPWYVYHRKIDYRLIGGQWKHYRRVEIEIAGELSFWSFVYFIYWNLRASLGMGVKTLYNYVRYGFRDTMPPYAEFARVSSPLILIAHTIIYRTRKMFSVRASKAS